MNKPSEEKNFEELKQENQRLEYELNRSLKIEQQLARRIAQKEQENALLSVQFEEVSAGFSALKKKYEEGNEAE
ncbi:septal ring factor EnvC (AmiA/AmiB activator) [Cytobacillus horneckiae]|uniref:hypothetical protein n=1 Tax=Cytobacillus horneckiae TaxID=549687 RepID=UPI0019D0F75C|nr:hypothetical protein [Cytobacillus horneckiae]MBN6889894.1 hypothetical protein [Cytobacillus horneckiae]